MRSFLTTKDGEGFLRFRPFAIPLILAAIAFPIVGATSLAGTDLGPGLVLAVGGVAATTLVIFAVRAKPEQQVEVAENADPGHRILVVALAEPTPAAAERVADLAGPATDVRIVVPVASHRIDRWLSAEDDARREAEAKLARSAGTLVAAGLPVSGSVGDHDPAQALEDELRDFPADEVVVLLANGKDPLAKIEARLKLPLRRVSVGGESAQSPPCAG